MCGTCVIQPVVQHVGSYLAGFLLARSQSVVLHHGRHLPLLLHPRPGAIPEVAGKVSAKDTNSAVKFRDLAALIVWTVLFNRNREIIRDFVSIVTNELTMAEKVLSAIVHVLIFA